MILAFVLFFVAGCALSHVQSQNPLGGKIEILCQDQATGTLVPCPEPTEDEMKCHEEMAGDLKERI